MDQNIENMFLKTSMETFLRAKLREQEQINLDLKEQIATNVKVTPDDLALLIKLEKVAMRLVMEAQTQDSQRYALLEIADIIRTKQK